MTNQAAVSDTYIVRKIIQALFTTGEITTAEGILNKVEILKEENERLHAHDAVKAVHGWVEVEMCTGCGATYSLDQLAVISPRAVSCCPERDMQRTLVPGLYGSVTQAATENFIEQVANALHCRKEVSNYPQILSALHDVLDNSQAKSKEILELEKERDGLQRTLDLLNRQYDNLIEVVGGQNSVGALQNIERMKRDANGMDQVIEAIQPIPCGQSPISYIKGMRDRCRVLDETASEGLAPKTVFLPVGLEMHTADLIGSFAENLAQRLHYKQRQGYVGWDRDDWQDDCLRRLHTSDKPLDVAAFAVFAWYHDWSGSYEALVTMPGEFTPGETSVVHNHNITINIEGSVSGLELSGLLADYRKDDGPIGFRTE